MQPVNLVIVGLLLVIVAAAVWMAWRMNRSTADSTALNDALARVSDAQAALGGRLAQLGETQSAAQSLMGEQLQAQERAVTKMLDERLAEVTRRVGENLQKSGEKTTETLTQLQQRLAVIDSAQKNIAELSAEVVGLQDILSNKQARGAIGQTQMEDLVRNLLPPNAYEFQCPLSNGKRADCVIILPNPPGRIAIDSKYPLEAYKRLLDAKDEREVTLARSAFKSDVMKHIKDIAEKYIIPGETADTAIMFVPAESVFAELHDRFGDVVEEGFRRRVYIVSPTTLMATLNTVRAILKDTRMREQAHVIQREVTKMIDDVDRLDERVGKLASHFDQAQRDVKDIRVSTDKIIKRGKDIETIPLEDHEKAQQALEITREPDQPVRELLQ